jgi:excisionase family DNA binding protein
MTVAECQAATGFSRSALYDAIKRGELPGVVKIGRSIRISRQAIERWLSGEPGASERGSPQQLAVVKGGRAAS